MSGAAAGLLILARVLADPGDELALSDVDIAREAAGVARFFPALRVTTEAPDAFRACGSDIPCMGAELAKLGLDRGLEIAVNLTTNPVLVSVQLIEKSSERGSLLVEAKRDAKSVLAAIKSATEDVLTKADLIMGGRLLVSIAPPNAAITVEGRLVVGSSLALPLGTHRVAASLDKYESKQIDVVIARGQEKTLELELQPESSLLGSPWFWAAAGATVVAASAVVLAVAFSSSSEQGPLCQGLERELCR